MVYDARHRVAIDAAPARVWHAVTTGKGFSEWWCRGTTVDSPGEVGAILEQRFDGNVVRFRLDEIEPERRAVWTTLETFAPAWEGSSLLFELQPHGDATALRFVHRGLDDSSPFAEVTNTHWALFLAGLRRHMQGGVANPYPEMELVR